MIITAMIIIGVLTLVFGASLISKDDSEGAMITVLMGSLLIVLLVIAGLEVGA